MNRPCRNTPSPLFVRWMRSDAIRWLAVTIFAPLVAMGALGGSAFLAHRHDHHGMHLHPVGGIDGGKLAAADHAADHGHDPATDPEHGPDALPLYSPADGDEGCNDSDDGQGDDQDELPNGVIVSFADHDLLPSRGIDFEKTPSLARRFIIALAAFAIPPSPDLDRHIGPPPSEPPNLRALSAGDPLVRASRALFS
jgi:hypothetical protein